MLLQSEKYRGTGATAQHTQFGAAGQRSPKSRLHQPRDRYVSALSTRGISKQNGPIDQQSSARARVRKAQLQGRSVQSRERQAPERDTHGAVSALHTGSRAAVNSLSPTARVRAQHSCGETGAALCVGPEPATAGRMC